MCKAPVTQGCLAGRIVGYWTGVEETEEVAEETDTGEVLEALSKSSVDCEYETWSELVPGAAIRRPLRPAEESSDRGPLSMAGELRESNPESNSRVDHRLLLGAHDS